MKMRFFGNAGVFFGSLFILLAVILFQNCKKAENVQSQVVLSFDNIVIYSPNAEFSLFLSITPSVKDKWQITALPDYLIAEPMSGEINNSIQEIHFRFKQESTSTNYYIKKNIEVLTEKSGSAKTEVSFNFDNYIEITPEAIHFEEGVEQLTIFIENKSTNNKRLNIKTQHNWLIPSMNYLDLPPKSTTELNLTADWWGMPHGTVYSNIYLSDTWPNSPVLLYVLEAKVDIPHHKKLVADKQKIVCNYFETQSSFFLKNKGNLPIAWQSSSTADYITTSPAQGNLAIGDSILVMVDVDKSGLESQTYEEMLTFGWNSGVFEIPIQVNHYNEWTLLPKRIVDIEYWQQANKLLIIKDIPPSLVLFDPETLQTDSIPLPVKPISMVINQNEGLVLITASKRLMLFDLGTMSIVSDHVVSDFVTNTILVDNNQAYFSSSNAVYSVNLSNGNAVSVASNHGYIHKLIRHPFQDQFFLITSTGIHKYDFAGDNVTLVWSQVALPQFFTQNAWLDLNYINLVDKIGGIYTTQNGLSYIGGLNIGELAQFTSSITHNLSFAVSSNTHNKIHVFDPQLYDVPTAALSLPDMINFSNNGNIGFYTVNIRDLFIIGDTREMYVVGVPSFGENPGKPGLRKINF